MHFILPPDPGPHAPDLLRVVIEIPKNSANRYEYDLTLGVFRLSQALHSPIHYPGDYGFIPGTLDEDGFALDVLVMVADPSFTGCLIEVRPVGMLTLLEGQLLDAKVLAVPTRNPRYTEVLEVEHVPPHTKREIEHFFEIYKELEGHKMTVQGWHNASQAKEVIVTCRQRYVDGLGAPRPVLEH